MVVLPPVIKRESFQSFCVRTGREFLPLGEARTDERMRNLNAWYAELEVKE
jgi:hypothetical protein